MQELTHLRGNDECSSGRQCPSVKRLEGVGIVITGPEIIDEDLRGRAGIGPGETAVIIPLDLLPELADGPAA